MLSNTCKYGIRATIYLAKNAGTENKIGIKKIADDLKIPTPFLGKILQQLAKHKLLSSVKGPNGGFGLARDAKDIALLDVIEIIDGLDFFETCLIGLQSCTESPDSAPCPLHDKYGKIRDELKELFDGQTIHGFIEEIDKSGGKINL